MHHVKIIILTRNVKPYRFHAATLSSFIPDYLSNINAGVAGINRLVGLNTPFLLRGLISFYPFHLISQPAITAFLPSMTDVSHICKNCSYSLMLSVTALGIHQPHNSFKHVAESLLHKYLDHWAMLNEQYLTPQAFQSWQPQRTLAKLVL